MAELLISSQIMRVAVLLGLFAVVAIVAYFGITVATSRMAVRQDLATLTPAKLDESKASAGSVKFQSRESAWAKLADMVERTGLDLTDTKSERLREKLVAAGF